MVFKRSSRQTSGRSPKTSRHETIRLLGLDWNRQNSPYPRVRPKMLQDTRIQLGLESQQRDYICLGDLEHSTKRHSTVRHQKPGNPRIETIFSADRDGHTKRIHNTPEPQIIYLSSSGQTQNSNSINLSSTHEFARVPPRSTEIS